jgi:1,5-anhydro-D-fructose reductase (1,5-anhydro-D-mannitol-forming)
MDTPVLRWAIIGAGSIAHHHTGPAIERTLGHQLRAIMRRDSKAAKEFAAAHGNPAIYTHLSDLLADKTIDAVYVATPPHLHREQTVAAAAAGKHVLCEKPLALTAQEASDMIKACAAGGVRLMVCHYQRFNTRHRRIKALLDEGAIGKVTGIQITFSGQYPPKPGDWHRNRSISGGGPLMDVGTHCLDLLMYLCGPVAESKALISSLVWETPVEDTATLLLRMQSGAHATIRADWSALLPEDEIINTVEIWGTKGSIVAAPINSKDSSGTLTLRNEQGVRDFSAGPGPKIHDDVIESFRRAIQTGQAVSARAEDAQEGLAIIEAAYEGRTFLTARDTGS